MDSIPVLTDSSGSDISQDHGDHGDLSCGNHLAPKAIRAKDSGCDLTPQATLLSAKAAPKTPR